MWPSRFQEKNHVLVVVVGSNESQVAAAMKNEAKVTVSAFSDMDPANETYDHVFVDVQPQALTDDQITDLLSKVAQVDGYKLFWNTSSDDIRRLKEAIFAHQRGQSDLVVLQLETGTVCGVEGLMASFIPSTAPKQHKDLADVWTDVHMPLMWRAAVYSGISTIMTSLLEKQLEVLQEALGANASSSYVEVGCGTAEMQSRLHKGCRYAVGVELSPMMLKLAEELHPELSSGCNHLVCANATTLEDALQKQMPNDFWNSPRVVTILMNTLGILPDAIRQPVIEQMMKVAGDEGTVIIGCWHRDSFSVGVEQFYKEHPELCGVVEEDSVIDIENANLLIHSTGYESHWFGAEEIEKFIPSTHRVEVKVMGVGIFVVVRKITDGNEELMRVGSNLLKPQTVVSVSQ